MLQPRFQGLSLPALGTRLSALRGVYGKLQGRIREISFTDVSQKLNFMVRVLPVISAEWLPSKAFSYSVQF